MYHYFKLSSSSINFINLLNSSGKNRSRACAIAVAYVISGRLALPSARLEGDISDYYVVNCRTVVENLLDKINSTLILDTRFARKVVEELYSLRYRAMVPPAIPLAIRKGSGVKDFFGISYLISGEVLEEIEKSPEDITHIAMGIGAILDELKTREYTAEQETDRHVA